MENNSKQTIEDSRDERLLEKMGVMIEKMGATLESRLGGKMRLMLDEKFATLDPLFGAIQESFLAMDEKFKVADGKISALQLSAIDVQEKLTVLTEESTKVRETLDHHTTTLDAISNRMSKWDAEFPIMSHVVLKIEKWVTQAAPIVGVRYVREK